MHIFQRNTRVFIVIVTDDESGMDRLAVWLTENDIYALIIPGPTNCGLITNKNTFENVSALELIFHNEADAVLFKMQWCTENGH